MATAGMREAAELAGDRWVLLLVAALADGPRRFGDLAADVEGIAPNVLTDRLRRMESRGLVTAAAYQQRHTAPAGGWGYAAPGWDAAATSSWYPPPSDPYATGYAPAAPPPNGYPDPRPDLTMMAPYYFALWSPTERAVLNSAEVIERALWNVDIGGYTRHLPYSPAERLALPGPYPHFTAWMAQYHYAIGNQDRAEAIMREHARLARRNLELALSNKKTRDLVPGSQLIVFKTRAAG